MKRAWWVVCTMLALCLAAVGWAVNHQSAQNDFGQPDTLHTRGAGTVLVRGADWTLETFDIDGSCFLIRVGDQVTNCSSTHYLVGDTAATLLQGHGHRFVVLLQGSDKPLSGRWFSSTRASTPLSPAAAAQAVQLFVVELEQGENPWGLQVVDATGALVTTADFTGD